jgi:hypothetical protein
MLILSSNSDAISAGIGSFATSDTITTDLSTLLSPKTSKATPSQLRQAQGLYLSNFIGQSLDALSPAAPAAPAHAPAAPTPAVANDSMLEMANRLAAYLGNEKPFTTLEEANTWVIKHGNDSLGKD